MQATRETLTAIAPCFTNPHDEVLRFTKEIFGDEVKVDSMIDPESGVESVQIAVEAAGNVDKLLELNDRWHRQLAQLGSVGNYCLSLVPRDEPA